MNIIHKVVRYAHIPLYAAKLWYETFRLWGLRRWSSFWLAKNEEQLITLDGLSFLARAHDITTKMTDTFAILESVYHNLYNRDFFTTSFQIKESYVVIDIGGYIGTFAIPAARRAMKGSVYVFEPEPRNFAQLQKNIALNKLKNIHAFNHAIASRDETRHLCLDNFNPASNSLYLKGKRSVRCDAKSLATIFAKHDIRHCNFLKLDCEGAEYEILMNLHPKLLQRIEKIACEYHQPAYYDVGNPAYNPSGLKRFLQKNGFQVVTKRVNPYVGMLYAINKTKQSTRSQ